VKKTPGYTEELQFPPVMDSQSHGATHLVSKHPGGRLLRGWRRERGASKTGQQDKDRSEELELWCSAR